MTPPSREFGPSTPLSSQKTRWARPFAESVNFGTRRWIPIGARAQHCTCAPDTVKMDMRIFRHLVPMRVLPPELLEDTSDEEEGGHWL